MSPVMSVAAMFAAATAWQGPVPAPAGSEALDAQCLAISSRGRSLAAGPQREAFQAASLFFLGRLNARVSAARLETLLWEQSRLLNGAAPGPLVQRCGVLMRDAGLSLADIGNRISERERAAAVR